MSSPAHDCVMLAHGGGGSLTSKLLRDRVLPAIGNPFLEPLCDGAVLPWVGEALVFTTDSYVVIPLQFPGGDIGRLAVAGTVNDLAVMGAEPVYLSLGLILEEGLPLTVLDAVVASIAATAREAHVTIVTGDTKVIERRAAGDAGAAYVRRSGDPTASPDHAAPPGGMFINTAGIGILRRGLTLGVDQVHVGDAVLVTGPIAEHGLAVMSTRAGLEFETALVSDVAPLNGLLERIYNTGAELRFIRDATRGGLAGVLVDIAEGAKVTIEVDETRIPISPTARHAAEMLGLDPLTVANEGKCVIVVASQDAPRVLSACRAHERGREAALLGRVTAAQPPLVELLTRAGGRRVVQRPYGEDLPRIC